MVNGPFAFGLNIEFVITEFEFIYKSYAPTIKGRKIITYTYEGIPNALAIRLVKKLEHCCSILDIVRVEITFYLKNKEVGQCHHFFLR